MLRRRQEGDVVLLSSVVRGSFQFTEHRPLASIQHTSQRVESSELRKGLENIGVALDWGNRRLSCESVHNAEDADGKLSLR